MVEKIHQCLPSRKMALFCRRRLTHIQFVLSGFLSLFRISSSLTIRIEKLMRVFVPKGVQKV